MTTTRTYIARCNNGHRAAFEVAGFANNRACTEAGCVQTMVLTPVRGKVSAVKCGAKCRNSLGPSCSCECGGHNHAESFRTAA
jgi:hypothetical protein